MKAGREVASYGRHVDSVNAFYFRAGKAKFVFTEEASNGILN